MRLPYKTITSAEGDLVKENDITQNLFGVDGMDFTVNVISDSFNLGGAASDVITGDLLSDIELLPNQLINGSERDGSDEGRAIMQIIDVAADGNLAFHSGVLSQADYADGINELVDVEAEIIVSNVSYPKEPVFQDCIKVGLTTSQGDIAMKADIARKLFNVDGTGITVGVISDSFNFLGRAASDVVNGDLPLGITVLQDLPSDGSAGEGSDEGRAIMQIIHDVAPGANLLFHTGFLGEADYANGILELADAGADIIVSDVSYLTEPMFQDGIIAQAINNVTSRLGDAAVSYFASAGNNGRSSYESSFNSSGVTEPLLGGEFHDFDPGCGVDTFQSMTIPPGTGVSFSFQWAAPYFSASGGAGAPNDLDIFLYDSSGTNVLAGSAEDNIGNDPIEYFSFFNEGQTSEFNLAISINGGPIPNLIKYVANAGRSFQIEEFDTASGTMYGNANAKGAMAVGAARYSETPVFGTNPAQLEFFSSAGGTPILFDSAGDRLASPEIRDNLGIVAPDGTNTTFFGLDIPEDTDDFPNFFGTSASAPHAAAVAALMLDANPNLSPNEVYSILERTALDMDDPSTPGFDYGFDFASGYGFIDAQQALSQIMRCNPEPCLALGMSPFGALSTVFDSVGEFSSINFT